MRGDDAVLGGQQRIVGADRFRGDNVETCCSNFAGVQRIGKILFVDKRASIHAVKAVTRIFTGKAGGTTSLLSILVGKFLGVEQVPISYETQDRTRVFQIPKIIDGAITPVPGKARGKDTVISNSEYWIAPEIIVAKSDKSRMRAFGRNWNFAGRSAEICKLDWRGP